MIMMIAEMCPWRGVEKAKDARNFRLLLFLSLSNPVLSLFKTINT